MRRIGNERLGQSFTDGVGIAFVDHRHVFAIDEAEGRCRITRAGGGHRGEAENLRTIQRNISFTSMVERWPMASKWLAIQVSATPRPISLRCRRKSMRALSLL